jgi:hypothetical protein
MMEQHFEVKGRRRGSWRRDIYVCFFRYYLEGGSQRERERESARERVAMAIFLFYSLSSSPLSADAPRRPLCV